MKRAIVVGSAGQDGRILRAQLEGEGFGVIGISRAAGKEDELPEKKVDVLNRSEVFAAVRAWKPGEIYYLAAFHHSSQDAPVTDTGEFFRKSFAVHVEGLLNFLEAIRETSPQTRLFYAASSHIFGDAQGETQDEETPLNPRCVYGITKTAGLHCCRFYRQTYGVHASTGILYNHESPYRNEKFVSQKIIRAAIRIHRGSQQKLTLGDLSARIDWGYAPDYVDAMTRMVRLREARDFVVATGQSHSVLDFVKTSFGALGLDWKACVEENPALITRRGKVLVGNPAKLRALTGWEPSVTFEQMVQLLLDAQRDAT